MQPPTCRRKGGGHSDYCDATGLCGIGGGRGFRRRCLRGPGTSSWKGRRGGPGRRGRPAAYDERCLYRMPCEMRVVRNGARGPHSECEAVERRHRRRLCAVRIGPMPAWRPKGPRRLPRLCPPTPGMRDCPRILPLLGQVEDGSCAAGEFGSALAAGVAEVLGCSAWRFDARNARRRSCFPKDMHPTGVRRFCRA